MGKGRWGGFEGVFPMSSLLSETDRREAYVDLNAGDWTHWITNTSDAQLNIGDKQLTGEHISRGCMLLSVAEK